MDEQGNVWATTCYSEVVVTDPEASKSARSGSPAALPTSPGAAQSARPCSLRRSKEASIASPSSVLRGSAQLLERAPSLGALGATISGAGPIVLVWCHYEQTSAVVRRLHDEAEGWATVLRAPFETLGADVSGV